MHFQIVVAVLSCVLTICSGSGASWNYSDPSKWHEKFPNCGMSMQSPIDIKNAKCNSNLKSSLTFTKYDKPGSQKFTLENNGHTLVLLTESTGANIELANVATFKLIQLHFHWGSDNTEGSEHKLKGKAYPAEMHLVHYNTKYSSFEEAKPKSDGLAVLGVFLKVGSENAAFKKILDYTANVTYKGNSTEVPQFAMQDLLPTNKEFFYRYNGSLTTPTCDQSVTWTVFNEMVGISSDQLKQFRILKDSGGKALVDNYRPVQNLNGREIHYWDKDGCVSGAQSLAASLAISLFSMLLYALV